MSIKTHTLGAAVALFISAPVVSAQELKLADFSPPTHFLVETTYDPMAAHIAEATDGEVTVRLYMGGELGPGPAEQYNRVVDGVADIAFTLPGYTSSNFPLTLMAELPGVIVPETGTQRIQDNLEMLASEYRRTELVALWNNAPNLLLMAEKEVNSIDDLAGLNIRVPSRNAGLVVQAWGATPVSMPAPGIYNAMQTGVIDGAMIDATTLSAFRLAEVTGSVTMGMDTTSSMFFLIMNRDSFADLDSEAQDAVRTAGRQAAIDGNAAFLAAADTALAAFAEMDGKTVIELSQEEAARFNAATGPVVTQIIADAEAEGLNAQAYVSALKGE